MDLDAEGYMDDGFGGQNAICIIKPNLTGISFPTLMFDPDDPEYLCIEDGRLVVRLRTAHGKVESVRLVTDRGEWSLEQLLSWDCGDMWRVSISIPKTLTFQFVGIYIDGSEFTLPEDPLQ